MARLEPYEFNAPAHWASALINGDCSSFDDQEQASFDAWCESYPEEASEVVGCEEESWFGQFYFPGQGTLGCDMLTYQALAREDES